MENRNQYIQLKIVIVLIGLLTVISVAQAQKVENAAAQIVEEDLIITFDLMPKESIHELYQITIMAHFGNVTKEMQVKEGSLSDVRPGNRLQFVFSGEENFKNIKGEVDFSITAKMTFSPIRFISPEKNGSGKKGKPMDIKWKGGLEEDNYSIDLLRKGQLVSTIETQIEPPAHIWDIPKSTKAGSKYKFMLKSNTNPAQSIISGEFRIKRKIPLVVKVLPAAVLIGVGYILLKDSGSGSEGGDSFPNPPDLPTL